jgi:NTE family protein
VLAANAAHFRHGVKKLVRLWGNLHCSDVYRTDFASVSLIGLRWILALTPLTSFGLRPPRSLFDNEPLRDLLNRHADLGRIAGAVNENALHAVSVTASSYDRGQAVTFFQGAAGIDEWHRSRREGVATHLTIDHLMASAALPFIFPAQRIGREHFGDGSLRQTSPLSPAIHTGANRILVITTRDKNSDPPPRAGDVQYPSLGAIGGSMLDIIFMDNVDADVERAQRIDHTLSLVSGPRLTETSLREIEVMSLEPSEDIRDIARQHASAMPWTVRMLLRRLGVWGRDWRLVSYLMFEPPYCNALIELGYRDVLAKAGELLPFLEGR